MSFPTPQRPSRVCSHLHQIRIPSIAADAEVIITRLLSRWFSEHMSFLASQLDLVPPRGWQSLRYFDARTKRPAIRGKRLSVDKRAVL